MTSKELVLFSKRLKKLRNAKGLTQSDLAKALNISRSCLANYELATRHPGDDILQIIAEYFEVSTGYLLGENQIFYSVENEEEIEYSKILAIKTELDISKLSPAAKIALVQFFCFLKEKCKSDPIGIAYPKAIID